MKQTYSSSLFATLVLFVFPGHPTLAASSAIEAVSPRTLPNVVNRSTTVSVAAEGAPFYAVADPKTRPLLPLAWVSTLTVDPERMPNAPPGWIPIKALGYVKSKKVDVPKGWVRRSDVVFPGDYRLVIACWPVKHIIYTMGDYEVEIQFKTDGSGIVIEKSDEPSRQKGQLRTHAYMTQNIVEFSATNQDKRYLFTAGYKPSDRHLYPNGALDYTQQTLFSETELKGCGSSPTTKD